MTPLIKRILENAIQGELEARLETEPAEGKNRCNGKIKFKGRLHYLTELLSGENVGLVENDDASYENASAYTLSGFLT